MTKLEFTITFHSPFRIARGEGGGGAHDTIEDQDRLPASSLAGVMKATAKTLLGAGNPVIGAVFGSSETPSPWRWSAARPIGRDWDAAQPAARVRIDESTGTARDEMLVLAEQTGAEQARFSITKFRPLDPRHELTVAQHVAVLRVAAQATRSLGAWRRRGLGWVGITGSEPVDSMTVRTFLGLKA